MTVHARLNAILPAEFEAEGRLYFDLRRGVADPGGPPPEVAIEDARPLQTAAQSESAFFAEHGFVLLDHVTRVRDWDTEVAELYLPEIEAVIRERLFPGRRIEVRQMANLVRRGRDTSTPFYAQGVHSDFGLDPDDYVVSVAAYAGEQGAQWWRREFERPEVAGFVSIDFWRTTNMSGPLQHMPLALCDPSSVVIEDVVRTAMRGIAPDDQVTHHLSLRRNPDQRWYYYPGMTGDEMLAFKLFDYWKDAPGPQLGSCLHTAFPDPNAPADAEERQSCEHRVAVMVLRD